MMHAVPLMQTNFKSIKAVKGEVAVQPYTNKFQHLVTRAVELTC